MKKLSIKIMIFIIFAFVTYMLIFSLNSEITFYRSIEDVYAEKVALTTKRANMTENELMNNELFTDKIRIGGIVVIESLVRDGDIWKFELQNDKEKKLSVTFPGILPDLFSESVVVLAEGHLKITKSGVMLLEASQILTKHDENYQPKY